MKHDDAAGSDGPGLIAKFVSYLLRHRYAASAVILVSMLGAGYLARGIQFRFQYSDFFDHPKNPRMQLLHEYHAQFGDSGYLIMLIESRDVFTNEALRYADTLHGALATQPIFSRVISLPRTKIPRVAGDGVDTGPLVSSFPLSDPELQQLRKTALHSSFLRRTLVSNDGTAMVVLAEMRVPAAEATVAEMDAAIAAMNQASRAHPAPAGVRTTLTGSPMIESVSTKALEADQAALTPFVVLVIGVALLFTFRSLQGLVLPLAAVSVSIVWTAGIFGVLGGRVDLIASVVPTILLVYGVVDPIFVLHRYVGYVTSGTDPEAAIVRAVSELGLPCLLTSLSTALGFGAFAFATLPTIRHFGIIVAVGVLLAYVTTLTLLPILLSFVRMPTAGRSAHGLVRALDRVLIGLWRVVGPRRYLVIAAALACIALGAAWSSKLEINTKYVALLPAGDVRRAVQILERKLSGVSRFAVYFEGPQGSMTRPDVMRAIASVDHFIEQESIINSSTSLADILADTNEAFHDGEPAARAIPDSPRLAAQYLMLMDPTDRAAFVNDVYSRSQIRILMTDVGSKLTREFHARLQQELERQHFERLGIKASLTGLAYAARAEVDNSVIEMLWGFVWAFIIIVLTEWAAFRSARAALASIIPNVVPVFACFGFMALCGWDLQTDNSLVLCVSVGGLFNTTIQFIANVLQQDRRGETHADSAIQHALRTVAPPALYTATILSAGLSVLLLSKFPGLQKFSILCAITLMIGFVSDAIVTPALIRVVFPWSGLENEPAVPPTHAVLQSSLEDHS